MGTADFCGGCGRRLNDDERFCPGCGRARSGDAAVVLDKQSSAMSTPVQVPASAPLAPFDPYKPISETNPLPPDCIWNSRPYPGPMPENAARAWTVPGKFQKMGKIAGRPAQEIIGVVGLPNSISGMPDGGRLRQWMNFGAYSGRYHYVLRFDRYDICIGITHESHH